MTAHPVNTVAGASPSDAEAASDSTRPVTAFGAAPAAANDTHSRGLGSSTAPGHGTSPLLAPAPTAPAGPAAHAPAVTQATSASWSGPGETDLQQQVVQSLWLHAREGGGEARVRLRPEYLGELTVRVSVERGAVTARLEAETPAVREWIERHELSLRQALGEYGLTLEALTIEAPSREEVRDRRDDDAPANREAPPRPRRPRRQATEDEAPRFEVLA